MRFPAAQRRSSPRTLFLAERADSFGWTGVNGTPSDIPGLCGAFVLTEPTEVEVEAYSPQVQSGAIAVRAALLVTLWSRADLGDIFIPVIAQSQASTANAGMPVSARRSLVLPAATWKVKGRVRASNPNTGVVSLFGDNTLGASYPPQGAMYVKVAKA